MACNDCPDLEPNPNSGCLQPTVTSCITYNGEDKACADISAGQTLNQVIEQLADNDCTLQEQIDDIKDDIDELSGSVNDLQDQIDEINNSITTFSCEDLSSCSIDNLGDVLLTTPMVGQYLSFNGTGWVNQSFPEIPEAFTCESLSSCSIDNLSDVDVTPVSGDILKFNGTNWVNYTPEEIPAYQFTCEELSGCTLDELSGVTLTDPVSGQVLFFNGTQWINSTPEDITPYQFTCEELSGCTMDELSGVNLTTPMSGDVLIHDGNAFINYPFSLLLSDLQNSINILNSQISFQSNLINLLHLRMDDCSCPTGATLDVDFSGCTIDICFQDSSPGKLFGSLHLAGSGTDFDSFDGVTMATIYVSDSANPSNTTKVVGYVPPETGLDVTYNIQLLSGMGNPIDTPVGLNTRTITFVVRFYDTNSILHFLSITANIPQLNNTDCSLNTSISYTLDDF